MITIRTTEYRVSKFVFTAALMLATGMAMPAFAQNDEGGGSSPAPGSFSTFQVPTEIATADNTPASPAAPEPLRPQITAPTEVVEPATNQGAPQVARREQFPPQPQFRIQVPSEVVTAPPAPAAPVANPLAGSSVAAVTPRREAIQTAQAPAPAPAVTSINAAQSAAEMYEVLIAGGYQVGILGRDHLDRYTFSVSRPHGNQGVIILVEATTGNIVAHRTVSLAGQGYGYASAAPAYTRQASYAAAGHCSPSGAYSARY